MTSSSQQKGKRSFVDLLFHIHPRTVPEETLRFGLSFGLGGMAATLVLLLFATGMIQLLTYEPTVSGAYLSVKQMYTHATFGGWVRNIHHWSANFLVIVAALHLLRVFLTGAFGPGRQLNWIIGLVLLVLVLCANFSGYLLPWDQLGYWAVTICTGMMGYIPGIGSWLMELFRGGSEVGAATLAVFYGLHIAFIPGAFLVFLVWHFWLVRKSGGLIRADMNDAAVPRVSAVPDLVVREAAVGLGLVALTLLVAVFFDAPLQEQANPGWSPNPAKAPWYFLGFQELLLHLHPVFAVCIVPALAALFFVLLPFWPNTALPGAIWFGGRRGWVTALWFFASGCIFTFLLILMDERLLRTAVQEGGATADSISRGILPTCAIVFIMTVLYKLLVKRFRKTRAEAVMICMILCCACLFALTVTGIWLRGPGMLLIWP